MGAALLSGTMAMAQSDLRFSYDGRPEKLFRPLSGLNKSDQAAVRDAAVANMFEIQTSELALKYGRSDWVRQFAKEMIEEHTAAHEELRGVAEKKNLSLPKGLPAAKQSLLAKLGGMRGDAFDAYYRSLQLKAHSSTSYMFQQNIKRGHDQDVRGYLVKMLPAVKMHSRLAKMEMTMTGPTKMKDNG